MIRSLIVNDLNKVASVHLAAFPSSALTKLGFGAVRRYYEWQLKGPHQCLAIGFFEYDILLGFSFGGKFKAATSGFIHKNRGYLILNVIVRPWLIANPLILDRLKVALAALRKTRRQVRHPAESKRESSRGNVFTILSIAVSPEFQGKGVGHDLMIHSENFAKEHGYNQLHLTVHPENVQAVSFYEKYGFIKVNFEDKWAGAMVKYL